MRSRSLPGSPWGFLLTACLVVGCGSESDALSEVQVSDSAGVRVVSLGDLSSVRAPELNGRRIARTDLKETVLFNVEYGAFLDDGSLLLANLGTSELILLDPHARETRRIGRAGEGPGEYRWPSWLEVVSEEVWVYDKALRRLTQLDRQWTVLRTLNVESDDVFTPLAPLTIVGDTVLAVHGNSGRVRSQGEWRDTTPLFRVGPTGSLDTLGVWPGEERAFATIPQGQLVVPIIFGRRLASAGRAGQVVLGSTDSIDVRRIDRTGRVSLILRGPGPVDPATPEEIAEYREALLGDVPMDTPPLVEAWRGGPQRAFPPPFGDLLLDDMGRVWVGASVRPGDEQRLWIVFDSTGLPVGRVELPTQFSAWPRRRDLLDVAGNRVALLLRNNLDEEYIEIWEIR